MKIMTGTEIMVILIGTEMIGVNRYINNRNRDNGNKQLWEQSQEWE